MFVLCHNNNFLVLFIPEKIAFHASLSSDIRGTTNRQTIVFDQVDTNLGGGYNGTTGVFTAPVAGTYVFTITFFMWYDLPYVNEGELHILKNNDHYIRVWVQLDSNANHGSASETTVLSLNKEALQTCILMDSI